jgi:hypothetical protein
MAYGGKVPKGKTIINERGRIIVIGDPHGCYQECLDMFDLLQVTADDTVIFAGDMVDRGPDNDKCMDLAMNHECVLANHEDKHLRYCAQEERGEILKNLPPTHAHTRSQLRPEHYEHMKQLPHFIRLPQYNHAVVHGGCWPGIPLEEQNVDLMIRLQYINPEKSKKSFWAVHRPVHSSENEQTVMYDESFKFWTHWWKGPERIVFGHSVLNRPLITENAVGIDGGCVFGLALWAYVLPEMKIYEVKSRMPHRGDPAIHMITDTVGTY